MPVPDLDDADLRAVAARFSGDQLQTPPMYSAIKRGGVPLYELARKGVEVEREPRPITITRLELTRAAAARVRFRVACSKGTYVRVLAEDIGRELGTVAHLAELRRTGFGPFRIGREVAGVDEWDPATASGLLSIREALADLPAVELPERSATAVRRGQGWVLRDLAIPETGARTALLLAEGGRPLAVVERSGAGWRFARVLG
jgi:tRNA pseudouridine55 synthase